MDRPFQNRLSVPVPDFRPVEISDRFDRQIDTLQNPAGGGGGAAGPYPFDMTFTALGGGSYTAAILPGTINGIIPSNFATTYTINNTTVYYLILNVTVSGGAVTAATLSLSTTPPTGIPVNMGQPPLSFEYLLGVVVDATWYRTIGNGSLTATAEDVYHVSKTSPAPGTLPYDIYYTWGITEA